MDEEELQAARDLIAFANDYAQDVFGKERTNLAMQLFRAADILERYLNQDSDTLTEGELEQCIEDDLKEDEELDACEVCGSKEPCDCE
jgi:uncharacterized protein YqeY